MLGQRFDECVFPEAGAIFQGKTHLSKKLITRIAGALQAKNMFPTDIQARLDKHFYR